MEFQNTLMWKEINETPRIFGEIQAENKDEMAKLVSAIKSSKSSMPLFSRAEVKIISYPSGSYIS